MEKLKEQIKKLPQAPGVYFFFGAAESAFGGKDTRGEVLYIGKATNLRTRVQSYFRDADNRGQWIAQMVAQIADIDFQTTDSVLEALILESNLIKKYHPKYNTKEKDDKSFSYFVITKDEFPRVVIVRKTDLETQNLKPETRNKHKKLILKKTSKALGSGVQVSGIYGPYTSKFQMQIALKIIRKIFPFHAQKQKSEKGCLDFQIGMCPGPYANAISKIEYKKNIRAVRMILDGKKKRLLATLKNEMEQLSKKHEFEKAAQVRNKIFALEHIRDVALMGREFERNMEDHKAFRVEAYDISNISGEHAVASMVVFNDNAPDKSQYRKFTIKTVEGIADVESMKEVLMRRFHNDWSMPDLIVLDGGQGHFNMGLELVNRLGLAVSVAAVAKGPTRKKLELRVSLRSGDVQSEKFLADENRLKYLMDEAHRFAISFHRQKRRKNFTKK